MAVTSNWDWISALLFDSCVEKYVKFYHELLCKMSKSKTGQQPYTIMYDVLADNLVIIKNPQPNPFLNV